MRTMDYRPRPEEPSPREIVKRLHGEIARLSPDRAELVAAWDRKQEKRRQAGEGRVHPGTPGSKQARIQEYGDLLAEGLTRAQAAAVVGVTLDTAGRYEVELRRQGHMNRRPSPAGSQEGRTA